MKVVLVEDSQSVREALLERLREVLGVVVVGLASHCSQAYATVMLCQPDAVILDIGLADGSGLEVLERLRSAGYSGRVLMLTASDHSAGSLPSALKGANGYYDKAEGLDRLVHDVQDLADLVTVHRVRRLRDDLVPRSSSPPPQS